MTEDQIKFLTFDDIQNIIKQKNKKMLQDIAVFRFGSPKGSIKNYSLNSLIQKIQTFINNEQAMNIIADIAKRSR